MSSDTKTSNGIGFGTVVVIGILVIGGFLVVQNFQSTDDNDDRTGNVECFLEWETNQHRRVLADMLCEVGSIENGIAMLDLETSPVSWTTNGLSGEVVHLYGGTNRRSSGRCQVRANGHLIGEDSLERVVVDNGIHYACAVEVVIP